jgi:hypothetical protein
VVDTPDESMDAMNTKIFLSERFSWKNMKFDGIIGDLVHPVKNGISGVVCQSKLDALFDKSTRA